MLLALLVFGATAATALAGSVTIKASGDGGGVNAYAFRLQGTHGYRLTVSAFGADREPGSVTVTVKRGEATAVYTSPAVVTPAGIEADLGPLGSIDLARRQLGHEVSAHVPCSGRSERYEEEALEGEFKFRGEADFTRAGARRAKVLPYWRSYPSNTCRGGRGESFSARLPGARLRVFGFEHGRVLRLQVNKNRPGGRAYYVADVLERRGEIQIRRTVRGVAPAAAFEYDRDLDRATLHPPAPFSGRGTVSRSANAVLPIWHGDIALDFPGRPAVPVAGDGTHAGLRHARFTGGRPEVGIGFR